MIKTKKQLLFLRILLGVLIVCNMAVIFLFSSQSASKSSLLSRKVTIAIVEIFTKGDKEDGSNVTPPETSDDAPADGLTEEQISLVNKSHGTIRKIAHMLEFGSLATLIFLFLITWQGNLLWRYATSLGGALIYAATDELHQLFRDGRGSNLKDVGIDFAGAFIACTLALIVVLLIRKIKQKKENCSSNKEPKQAFLSRILQIFSRLQSFLSNQISKMKSKK